MTMTTLWDSLDEEKRKRYKEYCDSKMGVTNVFVHESNEPLYFDRFGTMINTDLLIHLLFSYNLN